MRTQARADAPIEGKSGYQPVSCSYTQWQAGGAVAGCEVACHGPCAWALCMG